MLSSVVNIKVVWLLYICFFQGLSSFQKAFIYTGNLKIMPSLNGNNLSLKDHQMQDISLFLGVIQFKQEALLILQRKESHQTFYTFMDLHHAPFSILDFFFKAQKAQHWEPCMVRSLLLVVSLILKPLQTSQSTIICIYRMLLYQKYVPGQSRVAMVGSFFPHWCYVP